MPGQAFLNIAVVKSLVLYIAKFLEAYIYCIYPTEYLTPVMHTCVCVCVCVVNNWNYNH